jgi:flavin reductase (DIM6/NTAB) family NADH-FMN oxidoreductase RutF
MTAVTDGEAFDRLVRAMDGSMVVVTAAYRGERGGCLVGFHTQCSIGPRRVAVWLSKANQTLRIAFHATHLGLHYLDRRDHDLARQFGASTGDDVDKFRHCAVADGPHGVPVLSGCANRLIGRRVSFTDDGGDHVCFVVEVDSVVVDAAVDLLRLSDVDDLRPGHEAEDRAAET